MSTTDLRMNADETVLLEAYAPLIDRCATVVMKRMNHSGDLYTSLDDLKQAARLAVVQAARVFNGSGDFTTFAAQRIYWAITNELRDAYPLSRRQFSAMKTGRLSFHRVGIDLSVTDLPAPSDEGDVFIRRRVCRAVWQLPPRLRRVVCRYYGDGQTLKTIGRALGISEQRASQLRALAVGLLARSLQSVRDARMAA